MYASVKWINDYLGEPVSAEQYQAAAG